MEKRIVKLFLRIALAVGFLSAVADRLGWWPSSVSAWGNWSSFLTYTEKLNPWAPTSLVPLLGWVATVAEVVLALCLLLGFRTQQAARASGALLLLFALSMTFALGPKPPLDYSVFAASAAAFSLALLPEKFWELDQILKKGRG